MSRTEGGILMNESKPKDQLDQEFANLRSLVGWFGCLLTIFGVATSAEIFNVIPQVEEHETTFLTFLLATLPLSVAVIGFAYAHLNHLITDPRYIPVIGVACLFGGSLLGSYLGFPNAWNESSQTLPNVTGGPWWGMALKVCVRYLLGYTVILGIVPTILAFAGGYLSAAILINRQQRFLDS
jgi:hypothetical protein